MRRLLRDEGGFAYLMVMVAAALFAAAGGGYFAISSMHQRVGAAHAGGVEALYLAEWGLEYGLYMLKNETGATEWAGVTDLAVAPGTVTVTVNRNPTRPDGIGFGQVELSSTGTADGKYSRTLKRRFALHPDIFNLAVYSQTQFVDQGTNTVVNGAAEVGTRAEFPTIRWTRLQSLATTSWSGSQTWTASSAVYDGIFYIDRDLRINGSSTLVKGSLFVGDDFTLTAASSDGTQITIGRDKGTYPAALIVGDNCTFAADDVTINGRVFCKDKIDITGDNITFNGGLYASQRIRISNAASNVTINYRPVVVENADEYFYYAATPARAAKAALGGWSQPMQ